MSDVLALDQFAERAYLEYAMSVVRGRALPELSDGQKPVQRRILFAMYEMGLSAGAKPVKSARVVGEILGKFHPHGDASAYEALVRMAQAFTLRYPLIDGQGNFGSRDGDGAAAMRYTEARLTPISELLLSELRAGTVEFVPNYDGAFSEPLRLPARLPMVLLNGASGIAVGMATEIPSHNLTEVVNASVALLENPSLSTQDILQYLPAPDFAGGGQIASSAQSLLQAYETGRGSVRVRARWSVERLARGLWRVIVHELPPQVSARKILAEIEELTYPKPKQGKKSLSNEQQQLRNVFLSQLDRVRDESDQNEPVRLVFEPKSSRQDPEQFMQLLLAKTSLETQIPLNFVMLGLDGRPKQKNIRHILLEWLEFRMSTLIRRFEFRLEQVRSRLHILAGRLLVWHQLDAVIAVIRDAEFPAQTLREQFGLSDAQTQDILELRLRQLARLEVARLEDEQAALTQEAHTLTQLLSDESARKRLMKRELLEDAKRFGDARRTMVCEVEKVQPVSTVLDEALTVILSEQAWIRARSGHGVLPESLSFKEGDALAHCVETRTVLPVIFLDQFGRSYSIDASALPTGRGEGVPLSSLIDLPKQATILGMYSGEASQKILLASRGGYGFIVKLGELVAKLRSGKAVFSLNEGEELLPPIVLNDESQTLVVASSEGRVLAFALSELKEMSKGRGLQLMALGEGKLVGMCVLDAQAEQVHIGSTLCSGRHVFERIELAPFRAPRGRRGKLLPKFIDITQIKP